MVFHIASDTNYNYQTVKEESQPQNRQTFCSKESVTSLQTMYLSHEYPGICFYLNVESGCFVFMQYFCSVLYLDRASRATTTASRYKPAGATSNFDDEDDDDDDDRLR